MPLITSCSRCGFNKLRSVSDPTVCGDCADKPKQLELPFPTTKQELEPSELMKEMLEEMNKHWKEIDLNILKGEPPGCGCPGFCYYHTTIC